MARSVMSVGCPHHINSVAPTNFTHPRVNALKCSCGRHTLCAVAINVADKCVVFFYSVLDVKKICPLKIPENPLWCCLM